MCRNWSSTYRKTVEEESMRFIRTGLLFMYLSLSALQAEQSVDSIGINVGTSTINYS